MDLEIGKEYVVEKGNFYVWWKEGSEPHPSSTSVNLIEGNRFLVTGRRNEFWMEAKLTSEIKLETIGVIPKGRGILIPSSTSEFIRAGDETHRVIVVKEVKN